MKFYPVRYWWTDRMGERTGTTVAAGTDATDALRRFRQDHPHLNRSVIIEKPAKTAKAL